MALVPFPIPDQFAQLEEIITTQFRDQPVIYKYLRLWVEELMELFRVYQDLAQERDIDSATGEVLNIIGRIVGQERTIVGGDLYDFFGFKGHLQALGFGDNYVEGVGGMWWSLGKPMGGDVTMTDEQYRLAIKARIMRNNARGTPEDMLTYIRFVFGVDGKFTWNEGGVARVGVGRKLTNFEKALIAAEFSFQKYPTYYSPKPVGVTLELFQFDSLGTLGFIGTPNAKGMITLSNPNPDGGIFASVRYFDELPPQPPQYEVDFTKDPNFPAELNFTRAGTATYRGADGLIKTAAANTPRFGYNADGTFAGLILEEARTNVLLHSSDYTQAAWQKGASVAITKTNGLAPDGTNTAQTITSSGGAAAANRAIQFYTASVTAATVATFSVWMRSDTPVTTMLRLANQGDGDGANVTITTTPVWTRHAVTRQFTGSSAAIRSCLSSSSADGSIEYWGAQLELSADASSYIPTGATATARAVENCKTSPLTLPADGFTYAMEYVKMGNQDVYPFIFSDTPTSLGAYVGVRTNTVGATCNSTEGARSSVLPHPAPGSAVRAAMCVSNNMPLNRIAINNVLSAERLNTLPTVNLGARNILKLGTTTNNVSGLWRIKKYAVYTVPFSADQLAYLTYA